jgi:hypothetical protein
VPERDAGGAQARRRHHLSGGRAEGTRVLPALYNIKRAARIFVTSDRTHVYHRDAQYFDDQRAALVDPCGRCRLRGSAHTHNTA